MLCAAPSVLGQHGGGTRISEDIGRVGSARSLSDMCAPLIASEVHLTWQAAIGAVQLASVIRDLLRRR